MEIIQVFLIDLPASIKGVTIRNGDDSYTILINAGLSAKAQCDAYDHEMEHIRNHDYDHFYDIGILEDVRHSA